MPRARNLKPGFFKNERLVVINNDDGSIVYRNPLIRILFEGLWTLSDREGRLDDRPLWIKAEVLPYDNCDITALLDELASIREEDGFPSFIVRYTANGRRYIQILNFKKHNSPHIKEPSSTIPAPDFHQLSMLQEQGNNEESREKTPDDKASDDPENPGEPSKINITGLSDASTVPIPESTIQTPDLHGEKTPESPFLNPESGIPHPSTESNISLRDNTPTTDGVDNFSEDQEPPAPDPELEDLIDFLDFWSVYPRSQGQKMARDTYQALIAEGVNPADLYLAAGKYALKCKSERTQEKFIKMPHTFLTEGTYKEYLPPPKPDCSQCPDRELCINGMVEFEEFDDQLKRHYTRTRRCPHMTYG